MRKIFVFSCAIILFVSGNAQTFRAAMGKQEWIIMDTVYTSPNEVAAVVKYGRNDYGAVLFSSDLKLKWSIKMDDVPVAIGKFHDKLLVIASTGSKADGQVLEDSYDGLILDPANGNIVTKKNIVPKSKDNQTTIDCIFNRFTSDFRLITRITENGNSRPLTVFSVGSFNKKQQQTRDCKIISYNDDLSEASRTDFPILKDQNLLYLGTNGEGQIYTEYFDGGNTITVQEISGDGKNMITAKSFSLSDVKNKYDVNTKLFLDNFNHSLVYVSFRYKNQDKDYQLSAYKIDLSNSAPPLITSTVLNKEFIKSGDDIKMPLGDHKSETKTKNWDEMDIDQIFSYKDYTIVYKEASWTVMNNYNSTSFNGDGILSIYDNKMQQTAQQILPKEMAMISAGGPLTTRFHILNNILYFISVSDINLHGFSTKLKGDPIFGEYDLSTNKLIKYDLMTRADLEKENDYVPDPSTSIWFPDSFVFNYITGHGFGSINLDSYPLSFSYK